MAATAAQIRNKAAQRLGLKSGTLNLSSDISDDLDEAYNEIWADLEAKDIVNWDLTESVPDEFVNPVVDLVAESRVVDYAVSRERFSRIVAAASTAEKRIRKVLDDYVYKPVSVDGI